MSSRRVPTDLLAHGGRLLLEYNESTREITRTALKATARAMTGEVCQVAILYGGVAVAIGGESPVMEPVRELRYNTGVQARVHAILEQVCQGELMPDAALARLKAVEAETGRTPRWLAVLALGAAAAGLAALAGADAGTVAGAALATGLGLLARQALGQSRVNLLAQPLSATLIGALLGGVFIRLNWTRTPDLILVVPALVLVPGPHLINGLFDLIDNYLPMGLARLGLAGGILLASGLGILLGVELVLSGTLPAAQAASAGRLSLGADVALAGVVTVGFAAVYNATVGQAGMAAVGGMAGHGLRYLALGAGSRLEAATFVGGLAVGLASAAMARTVRTPVAVIAFAGAVTMMPGLHMYRALGGAVELARLADQADTATVAAALGNALEAGLVVSGLALGLIAGSRPVLALPWGRKPPIRPWKSDASRPVTS